MNKVKSKISFYVYVFICMIFYKGRKIDMNEINNLLDDGCNS